MENDKCLRVIDANLNRAREGFRVVEDTARFVFENKTIYKKIRSLRHKMDKTTRNFYPRLIASRNSSSDSGRKIKEDGRKNLKAVIAANFRRAEESLRVLEEYSKFLNPGADKVFKSIRFETYILEKIVLEKYDNN